MTRAATLWLTGLPCSGKTTLATALATTLRARGTPVLILDGDEVRTTLSADLGFDAASRDENVRRVAAVAALAVKNGITAIVALVSPHRAARDAARAKHGELPFLEVHLSAPLSVCEARDVKGLYARARAGKAKDVTGVDAPYEAPSAPELSLPPDVSVAAAVERVLALLTAPSR
ncbi:MAG: adenylyl-sulfate kinase [Archangium sp.]